MRTEDIKNMAKAYAAVLEKAHKKDKDEDKLDPVNKKALAKDFDDRDDKDIDNDGDVDSTDKYLHKRRKAVSKAIKKDADNNNNTEVQTQEAADDDTVRMMKDNPNMKKKGGPGGLKGLNKSAQKDVEKELNKESVEIDEGIKNLHPGDAHAFLKKHDAHGKNFFSLRPHQVSALVDKAKEISYKGSKSSGASYARQFHDALTRRADKFKPNTNEGVEIDESTLDEGTYVGGPPHTSPVYIGGHNSKKSKDIRIHLINKGHSFEDHSHSKRSKEADTHYISMHTKEGHAELLKAKAKHKVDDPDRSEERRKNLAATARQRAAQGLPPLRKWKGDKPLGILKVDESTLDEAGNPVTNVTKDMPGRMVGGLTRHQLVHAKNAHIKLSDQHHEKQMKADAAGNDDKADRHSESGYHHNQAETHYDDAIAAHKRNDHKGVSKAVANARTSAAKAGDGSRSDTDPRNMIYTGRKGVGGKRYTNRFESVEIDEAAGTAQHKPDEKTRDTWEKQLSTRKGEKDFVDQHKAETPPAADVDKVLDLDFKTFKNMTKKSPARSADQTKGDTTIKPSGTPIKDPAK